VKIILLWEESVISFWITAVFLGIGLVSLVLPWAFILTWLGRIVVHGFFGPHMKILDLYLRANKSDDLNKLMEAFDQKKRAARLRREQALKVKAVKCLRFGDYITQVPAFNLARHYDCPLPSSTAKIVRKPPKIEFTSYSPGQQLYGDMIPRLEDGYLGNQIAVLERMKRLSALESRLVLLQAAARVGGELLRRRRQLRLKPPSLEEFTPESGYELVQLEAKPLKEVHIPSPDMSNGTSKRMSVKETNGHTYLIMECSGENSMEEDGEESNLLPIKLPEDEFCDEVGVDIVLCEDESVLWSADEEQTNYYTGNLALVFKESETTFVTFYRS
jgi:RNA binding exosome subunit